MGIEQTFNGNPDFGKKVTCTLSRNGDLIHKIWLWVKLPTATVKAGEKFRWLNWLGHVLIDYVEFEIGGQMIDNVPALTNLRKPTTSDASVPSTSLYIPLQFYFCRNPGLAVPLVALQYHEVKINIEFRPLAECV